MVYKFLKNIKLVLALGIVYLFFYITGVGCPIQYITGISCAGCGMTRAWMCVLRLDFQGAFMYHPLFWTIPLAVAVFFSYERLPKKICKSGIRLLLISFIVVYLVRLIDPSNLIVQMNVRQGIIFKIYEICRDTIYMAVGK